MARFNFSDEEIERLFSGRSAGPGELEDVGGSLKKLAEAFVVPIQASTVQAHLTLIHEEAARAAQETPAPAVAAAGSQNNRRKGMFAALFASFWAKLAGFALAGAVVTGGLGVSGNIPGPGQELFNNAAQQVGIPVDDDVIEDKAKTDEVTPGQDEDIDAEKVQDGEKPSINHGHCVSYAAKVAGENLDPGDKGRFVRIVAGNKDAVSGKVAEGEAPDAACAAAISAAMAQVQPDAASKGSEDNRKPKGRPGGEADGLKGGTEVETDAGKEKKRSETVKQDRPHNEKKSKSAPGSGPPASPGGKPQ